VSTENIGEKRLLRESAEEVLRGHRPDDRAHERPDHQHEAFLPRRDHSDRGRVCERAQGAFGPAPQGVRREDGGKAQQGGCLPEREVQARRAQ